MKKTSKTQKHVKRISSHYQHYFRRCLYLFNLQNFNKIFSQNALILCIGVLFFSSCQKQDIPKSETRIKQEQIAKELGFKTISDAVANPNNSLVFNSIEEAKAYFKVMHGSAPVVLNKSNIGITSLHTVQSVLHSNGVLFEVKPKTFRDPISDFNDDNIEPDNSGIQTQYHHCTMELWFGINGMRVNFNYAIDDNGLISAKDFNSDIEGITAGLGYTQKSVDAFSFPGSSYIRFTIIGIKTYSLFIGGIGTIATRQITINGRFNTNTGEKIITFYEGDL